MRTSRCTLYIFGVSIYLTLARNTQKEFLIGQSSVSHATLPTIFGWLLVLLQWRLLNVDGCYAECQKPLAMDGFYTKDGAHYCADDYHRLFVSRCRICGELAEGNVVSVLGDTYHQQCFHCSRCG